MVRRQREESFVDRLATAEKTRGSGDSEGSGRLVPPSLKEKPTPLAATLVRTFCLVEGVTCFVNECVDVGKSQGPHSRELQNEEAG